MKHFPTLKTNSFIILCNQQCTPQDLRIIDVQRAFDIPFGADMKSWKQEIKLLRGMVD